MAPRRVRRSPCRRSGGLRCARAATARRREQRERWRSSRSWQPAPRACWWKRPTWATPITAASTSAPWGPTCASAAKGLGQTAGRSSTASRARQRWRSCLESTLRPRREPVRTAARRSARALEGAAPQTPSRRRQSHCTFPISPPSQLPTHLRTHSTRTHTHTPHTQTCARAHHNTTSSSSLPPPSTPPPCTPRTPHTLRTPRQATVAQRKTP
mmetsp:Transcript_25791/g.61221  ORF Transcript_25791/g.61221 Transcript_25791/m.61221 type:complete len:213 (+) Transcript_25791:137-775(+)